MSLIRLILIGRPDANSGLIPSKSLSVVIWALAEGGKGHTGFWAKVATIDPSLEGFFRSHQDAEPLLDGHGDGLLVVNWEHQCIESFQEYQPVRREGTAPAHSGLHTMEGEGHPYRLGDDWHLVDHQFEES